MKGNVLITTIGRRGTLTKIFKDELNKFGYKIIVTDNSFLAPALYQADNYYLTPRISDSEYIDKILDICKEEKIKVIIPLLEGSFFIFNEAREFFEEKGILLLLSQREIIDKCKDKYKLYQCFKDCNIPTPKSYLAEEIGTGLSFPMFIKPRTGQGSQDVFKVNNKEELYFFMRYIDNPIIQEYIEGTEYTIDTLSDLEGKLISAVPRKRIEVRAGEVNKAVTVKDERLINWAKRIVEDLGIIGPANIQAIITVEEKIKFIEINPRFGGGVPLSYQAGVNYPILISKMAKGVKLEPIIGQFEDGLAMLRYDIPMFLEFSAISK